MASAETIKEFLVALNFKIDEAGFRKFNDGVIGATTKVVAFAAAVEVAAVAVVGALSKMAQGMDEIYAASKRTGAAADAIQALGFAASQMGSSVGAATGSLEAFARMLRTNPGSEGLLASIGIQSRSANGGLKDTEGLLEELGSRLKAMPYYQANQYASVFGIDEKTLMALISGVDQFGAGYKSMLRAAGLDSKQAADDSHSFMVALRSLGAAFDILGQKIAASLTRRMSVDIEKFRKLLVDNFERITRVVTTVAKGILFLADVITRLLGTAGFFVQRLFEWFDTLNEKNRQLVEGIGLFAVALVALSRGLLLSPLGAFLALLTAIVLILDDYRAYSEGGKHVINWEKIVPALNGAWEKVREQIAAFRKFVEEHSTAIEIAVISALAVILNYMVRGWAVGMLAAFTNVVGGATGLVGALASGLAILMRISAVAAFLAALWPSQTNEGRNPDDPNESMERRRQREGSLPGDPRRSVPNTMGEWAAQLRARTRQALGLPLTAEDRTALGLDLPATGGAGTNPSLAPTGAPSAAGPSADQSVPRGYRNNNPLNLSYVPGQVGLDPSNPTDGRFGRYRTMADGVAAAVHQLQLYQGRGLTTVRQMVAEWAPPSENDTASYVAAVAAAMGISPDAPVNLQDQRMAEAMISAMAQRENGRPIGAGDVRAGVTVALGGVPSAPAPPPNLPAPPPSPTPPAPAVADAPGAPISQAAQAALDRARVAAAGGHTISANFPTFLGPPHTDPRQLPEVTINQNTTINVDGTDPRAVADEVLRGQNRVNSDLQRNFAGALQ